MHFKVMRGVYINQHKAVYPATFTTKNRYSEALVLEDVMAIKLMLYASDDNTDLNFYHGCFGRQHNGAAKV